MIVNFMKTTTLKIRNRRAKWIFAAAFVSAGCGVDPALLEKLLFAGCRVDPALLEEIQHHSDPLHDASQIEGVWQSQGYGRVAKIDPDGTITVYDYTDISCLLSGQIRVEDLSDVVFSNDGNTLSYRFEGEVTTYTFDRIKALPRRCSRQPLNLTNPRYNFDVFWKTFEENYAFFDQWGVDWQKQKCKYRRWVNRDNLFDVLTEMVSPMADGHLFIYDGEHYFDAGLEKLKQRMPVLSDAFDAQSDFDDFYDFFYAEMDEHYGEVFENYFGGEIEVAAADNIYWGSLGDKVGYLNILGMEDYCEEACSLTDTLDVADDAMDRVLTAFADKEGIVIDLRVNDGGNDAVSLALADRLATESMTAFDKRAVWNEDYTETQTLWLTPGDDVRFEGKIVILISPFTISAAETFLLPLIHLPKVTLVGDTTAGNFSDMLVKTLPNGWVFSLSNEVYEDPTGACLETIGIVPDIPMEAFSADDLVNGTDSLIEQAVTLIESDGER